MADNDLKQVTYGIEFDVDTNGIDKVEEKTGLVDTALQKLSSVLESFQNNLNKTSDTAKLMGDAMNQINDTGINKYNQQLELADRKLDILGTQYSLAAEKARSLYEESNKTVERFGAQSDQAMKVKEQLANAQMKELNLEEAVQKAGEAFEKQRELVDKVNSGIVTTAEGENKVANNASKATNEFKAMESVSGRIRSILGAFGIIGVTQSAVNGLQSVGKAYSDFTQNMAQTHAVLGNVSQKDMRDLSNAALNMSSKYGIAAKDVASGEETLASAGLNTKEVMKELEPTLLLATAGNIKMDAATADVTSTIKNFRLSASDATHVVDVFAKSAANTAAEMPDMATAMSYIAPIANSVGWSLEQTSAAIGELSNSGIKGSKAGTTLREIVSRLVYPTGKAADLIKQLGFSAIDPTTHKMKDMTKILEDLNKAMSSHGLTNSAEQNAALKLIFGQEAFTGVSALMKAPKQIDDLAKSLQHADGAGKQYANTMNDTLGKAFDRFKETVTNTFIKNIDNSNLGNSLKNFFNGASKYVPEFSEDLSYVLNTSMKVAKGIKDNFGDIKPVLEGLISTFVVLKGAMVLKSGIDALKTLGSLATPTTGIAISVGLMATAFGELKKGNVGLGALLTATAVGLTAISIAGSKGFLAGGALGVAAAALVLMNNGSKTLGPVLLGVAAALGALNIALAITDALTLPITWPIFAISAAIGAVIAIIALLATNWSSVWQTIKQISQDAINFVIGKINDFIDKLNAPMKLINQLTGAKLPTIPTVSYQHFAENKGPTGSKQTTSIKGAGKVSAYATGTNYAPGGLSLVGEKGPELVELPQGAKVTPNSQLNQALGQKTAQNFSSITDEYSKQVKQMQPLFNTYGQNLNANLSTGISNTKQNVSGAVGNTTSNAGNLLNNFAKGSYNYGTGMVGEMSQGVTDSSNNLTGVVSTLTNKVIDTFKQGFGIHSPSRVMYKIGDYLMQGLVNGMTSKDMEGFVSNWIGSMSSAAGGAVGGNLSGWITTAMALTGVPSNWFNALASIIQHESGGDPNSINLWDSNAAAGHPSKGLMQLIDENMSEYHLPGMTNIYDPVSNIAAGIKYIEARYGSIFNVPGISSLARGGNYVGYATGTNSATAGLHLVGENGPELVNLRGGAQVKTASETKNILQRTYSNSTSSSSKSVSVEAPQISITINESKDASSTAQEVKKVIEEYFKTLGYQLSMQIQ